MFADVVIPGSRLDALTYSFDEVKTGPLAPGDCVQVSLRGRKVKAVVLAVRDESQVERVLPVLKRVEPGAVSGELLGLLAWVSRYYVATLGETLALCLPAGILGYRPRGTGEKPDTRNTKDTGSSNTQDSDAHPEDARAEDQGPEFAVHDGSARPASGFRVTCLFQMESRFEAVACFAAECRRKGAVIVLCPEHKLDRWHQALQKRFGDDVCRFEGSQSQKHHRQAWLDIRAGKRGVVLGVRSAVFAPVPALAGIAVIDEHEEVFKEERRPCYHARDVAVGRARVAGCPVLLCSRTPSAETWLNVQAGRYGRVGTIAPRPERVGSFVVDRRKHRDAFLSPLFARELTAGLERGSALIYVNRLGLSRHVVCEECGYVLACRACRLPLALHADGTAACAFCGRKGQAPAACPECRASRFSYQAPGVELVAREVRRAVPAANVAVLTARTGMPASTGPGVAIVGTRTLLGWHWPESARMVGVVSFDYELVASDFRSRERAFQRMFEIERRAAMLDCRLVVQTWRPEEPVLRLALSQNPKAFLDREVEDRRSLGLPPFTRLALVETRGRGAQPEGEARRIAAVLARSKGLETLGPVRGPASGGQTSYRLLARTEREQRLDRLMGKARPLLIAKGAKVDVDPLSV